MGFRVFVFIVFLFSYILHRRNLDKIELYADEIRVFSLEGHTPNNKILTGDSNRKKIEECRKRLK